MMALVQFSVFAGAMALVAWVIASTVAPALPRMAALLRGELDPALAPRERLTLTPRAAIRPRPPVSTPRMALREAA